MKRVFVVLFCLAAACTPAAGPARSPASPPPARIGDRLLHEQLALTPEMGRAAGIHTWDGKLGDYSEAGIRRTIDALRRRRDAARNERSRSPDDELDVAIHVWSAEEQLFWIDQRQKWRSDPAFYEELFSVHGYIDRDYAPFEARFEALVRHEEAALKEIPHIRANLRPPLPKPIVDVATLIFKGHASYLRKDVVEAAAKSTRSDLKTRFDTSNTALAREAQSLADWLATVPTTNDYALGKADFQRLVDIYAGRRLPLDEFEKTGRETLARDQKLFDELSPRVPQPARPTAASLVATAQKITEEARAFIVERKVVSLPGDERAVVMETPPYLRYNAAWLDTPGPYDPPLGAFFYVTPPDPSWPEERQREYVPLTSELRATTTHEVYPGHFVQYAFLRKAPTITQQVVGSATFVEGWAHYGEQMMADEGFSSDPENHLGQVNEALLRDCRYLVALGIHTQGMTIAQAEQRFVDDCHQTRAVAKEQSLRGAFHPWYFAYTLGKLQILALREEAKKAPGYSLQRFHDALLSHGQGPVGLIRPRVLRDLGLPSPG